MQQLASVYTPLDSTCSKKSYRLCKKDYETDEEASAQQRDVEPLMSEWTNLGIIEK
jgi:hypothetical protein